MASEKLPWDDDVPEYEGGTATAEPLAPPPAPAARRYTRLLRDHEERAGVDPVEVVQADRTAAVRQLAPLEARVGSASVYDARRKAFRCAIQGEIADRLHRERGKAPAESESERLAAADGRYQRWLDDAAAEMAQLHLLRDEVKRYDEIINRGQAVLRFLTSEPKV